jgi:hypothetical protein
MYRIKSEKRIEAQIFTEIDKFKEEGMIMNGTQKPSKNGDENRYLYLITLSV